MGRSAATPQTPPPHRPPPRRWLRLAAKLVPQGRQKIAAQFTSEG